MAVRKTNVLINVDKDFFEKVFEPSREKIQKQLGVRVSQTKFTRMLFKNKIDLTPKLNFNLKLDFKLKNLNVNDGTLKRINKKR